MNHKMRTQKVRFEVVPIAEALQVARTIDRVFPANRQQVKKAAESVDKKPATTSKAWEAGKHVVSSIRSR